MSAQTQIRFASLAAATYGLVLVSGIVHHFQRTGSLRALVHSLSQPAVWIALVIATLVAFGLWKRYAWAWWLGVGAAAYQVFRITLAYVQGGGFGRVPGFATLLALALLVVLLVLLLPRKARLGCSR
jgi:benzodiazapine receptor